MTTTELASREQLLAWLTNYDSDIDARLRANAVLPGAGQLVDRLKDIRQALNQIPTPDQFHLQTLAAEDAEKALADAETALQEAQARFRRAKADHERAAADAIRSRKPFAGLEMLFNGCGGHAVLAMELLEAELNQRGVTVDRGRLQFPEDSDWQKYKTP